MRYEIQVHFENCGQLAWQEEIGDVNAWMLSILDQNKVIAYDEVNHRHYGFDMKRVNAIVLVNKSEEEKADIWSRTYAPSERKVEVRGEPEHKRDETKWISPGGGGRCCA